MQLFRLQGMFLYGCFGKIGPCSKRTQTRAGGKFERERCWCPCWLKRVPTSPFITRHNALRSSHDRPSQKPKSDRYCGSACFHLPRSSKLRILRSTGSFTHVLFVFLHNFIYVAVGSPGLDDPWFATRNSNTGCGRSISTAQANSRPTRYGRSTL